MRKGAKPVRERRLDELLRDARAHGAAPEAQELRQLQDAVLARFAAEHAQSVLQAADARARPARRARAWIERLAIAAGLVLAVISAAGWLGERWQSTSDAVTERLPDAPVGGWSLAFAEALAEQPMMWSAVLLAAALLFVRPVRESVLREIR
jgi:hypothetical protein